MNKNGITVLSLFDGMSCGQIAMRELGIKIDKYYASEIDKHAIKQTQLNFPDTIQLGSVTEVDARKLGHVDILIGGSPCTNFSFAGRRNGMNTTTNEEIYTLDRYLELKRQGFQFDGESFLFWEYMRILGELRETNPDVFFFFENVEMGDKWETVLTKAIGIPGVHINSALVSAQNRRRIYWTNIKIMTEGLFQWVVPDIPQPEDRGIMLADVLEDEVDGKYYLKDEVVAELKAKLENAKATAYAESVDAVMRERRLKRALWLARGAVHKANRKAMYGLLQAYPLWEGRPAGLEVHKNIYRYDGYERKCRAKADEYK